MLSGKTSATNVCQLLTMIAAKKDSSYSSEGHNNKVSKNLKLQDFRISRALVEKCYYKLLGEECIASWTNLKAVTQTHTPK